MNTELEVLLKDGNTENLIDWLPHGSGVDYDYGFDETDNEYLVSNSYHLMSEHGYYCGNQDFTIVINKDWNNNKYHELFSIEYNEALCDEDDEIDLEGLKMYLEEMFSYYFSQVIEFKESVDEDEDN